MVQTVYAPDSDANLEQLWKDISPEQMMDSKLKCVFELPTDQNDAPHEEPIKISPKVPVQTTSPPSSNIETELEKAAAEVRLVTCAPKIFIKTA